MSKRKRYAAEEIISKLREAEVHLAPGRDGGPGGAQARGQRADLLSLATRVRWDARRPGEAAEGARARERAAQAAGGRAGARQLDPARGGLGKLLGPAKRRRAVAHARAELRISERRACRVVGQARATQRYVPRESPDEQALIARMVALATRFGRYGYRRVTALLRQEGWRVNHKRVERLWRQEGLKVPQRQPKRRRLWLGDGSIVRRRAEHRDHVWSYDFVFDRTADGRPLRLLPIVDEYTRECLSIDVGRRLNSEHVLARLAELFVRRGVPEYIRSDNGPEFTAKAVRRWLPRVGVQTLFIEPGSPWENGGGSAKSLLEAPWIAHDLVLPPHAIPRRRRQRVPEQQRVTTATTARSTPIERRRPDPRRDRRRRSKSRCDGGWVPYPGASPPIGVSSTSTTPNAVGPAIRGTSWSRTLLLPSRPRPRCP